jgi:hypothetical protein
MQPLKLTAVFMKVSEGYVGFVEELPGANTQGETLGEVRNNLHEAYEWFGRPTNLVFSPSCYRRSPAFIGGPSSFLCRGRAPWPAGSHPILNPQPAEFK